MPEHQQIQQPKKPNTAFQKQATPVIQTPASNPFSIIQRAKINPKSLTHADIMQLQRTIGNRAVGRLLSGIGNTSTAQQATVQRQEIPKEEEPLQTKKENNTGIPDNLKSGVENLSGIDMNDVRVHYNSDKPAEVGALAYAQGTDIHVAPGQERHLPHEAWHVVQQAQGRVRPTMQLKDGVPINDDWGLEHEADVMGGKALQMMRSDQVAILSTSRISPSLQWRKRSSSPFPIPVDVMSEAAIQQLASSTSAIVQRIPEPAITQQNAGLHKPDRKAISSPNRVTPKRGKFSTKLKIPTGSLISVDDDKGVTDTNFSWAKYGKKEGYVKKAYINKGKKIGNSIFYSFQESNQSRIYNSETNTYLTGVTSEEITALLKVQPNAQIIHYYLTNVIPGFVLGNIIFASVAYGKVGSIYFKGGRVRLIHDEGPAVELSTQAVEQYTISYKDDNKLHFWLRKNAKGNYFVKMYNFVTSLDSCQKAVADQGNILVEFWGANGALGNHISRGGPKKFGYDLKQYHLNIIGNAAANPSNNNKLRLWMEAIPALQTIPIH